MKNKLKHKITDDDMILNCLGLLNDEEKENFVSGILSASDFRKEEIREFNNLASILTLVLKKDNLNYPSDSVKNKLFEKLNLNKKSENDSKNFKFFLSKSLEWTPHPEVEGIEIKPLSLNKDKGYLMLLMKAAAGCHYPAHHHSGAGECYVLEGDLIVEGKTLGAGDFHHAGSNSNHNPLTTKNGFTLLLVIDPEDL